MIAFLAILPALVILISTGLMLLWADYWYRRYRKAKG